MGGNLDSRDLTLPWPVLSVQYCSCRTFLRGADEVATIVSLEEPRPRGTVLGERADRRRVFEAEHYFRCKLCGGYLDARDLVWIEDHEGPLPHPAQDQAQ